MDYRQVARLRVRHLSVVKTVRMSGIFADKILFC